MKLGDLLGMIAILDENTDMDVTLDETGEIIATYDGKESIPKAFNPCIIKRIIIEI